MELSWATWVEAMYPTSSAVGHSSQSSYSCYYESPEELLLATYVTPLHYQPRDSFDKVHPV
jgi:hypothetical protein